VTDSLNNNIVKRVGERFVDETIGERRKEDRKPDE
jgi:hypothetical protein